jgi:serine protease
VSALGRHRSRTLAALTMALVAGLLPPPSGGLAAAVRPVDATYADAPVIRPTAPATGPTDLIRSREWPLTALHVPQAWRWSKGYGATVAVLDTGVDGRHPDLIGRVIQGPDFTGRERRPGGAYWGRHGTSMASIIAGHGHGPGRSYGVMGVAPQAKILSIRVTWENDDPVRSDRTQVARNRDAVAKGIRYAVDHGAQIINMSLGGGKMAESGDPAEEEAIRYALGKGAMLIASAGNDGAGLNRMNYPAAYRGVTAVGAVDKTLRPTRFTNRHDYVSVAAPGVDIVSADAGRSYVQGTGTSPSAALVAGIAALVRSRYSCLSPDQTKQALEQGTVRRPPGGRSTKVGAGVTDAVKAIFAGHHIAKTGCSAAPPQEEGQPATAPAPSKGSGLPVTRILAGGGSLVAVILILAAWIWRRGRRLDDEWEGEHAELSVEPSERVPVGAAVGGSAFTDGPPPLVPDVSPDVPDVSDATETFEGTAERIDQPESYAPVPPPAIPTDTPPFSGEGGYSADPLDRGSDVPMIEVTPLADQSWEIVLHDRGDDDPTSLIGDPLSGHSLAGDPLRGHSLAGDPWAGDPLAGDLPIGDYEALVTDTPVADQAASDTGFAGPPRTGSSDPFDYYWAFEPADDGGDSPTTRSRDSSMETGDTGD